MGVDGGGASAPANDEIEVSVFGRGHGEAILVHLGHGRWLALDSCLDDDDKPVATSYLEQIGVRPERGLRLVLTSHWHADHVGGLASLFERARVAQFACAATLHDPELVHAITHSGNPSAPESEKRSVDQFAAIFRELLRRKHGATWGLRGTVLWEEKDLRVWSLSPSSRIHTRTLTKLVQNAQRGTEASTERENLLTMVVWIEIRRQRLLLGGDLEERPGDAWGAALGSPGRRGERGHVFKVPHHGAESGHNQRVWNEMLAPDTPAAVTAFTRSNLPTQADCQRLRTCTDRAFLAGAKVESARRSEEQLRLIAQGTASRGLTALTGPLGQIRMRAPLDGEGGWTVKCFGNAWPL